MGISELRQSGLRPGKAGVQPVPTDPLGRELIRVGKISRSDAALATLVQRQCDSSFDRILRAEGLASEDDLLTAHARRLKARRIEPETLAAAPRIDTGLDPRMLLRHGATAIRDEMGAPRIVANGADSLLTLRRALPVDLSLAKLAVAPRDAVQARVARDHRDTLRDMATARVPEIESCRTWTASMRRRLGLTVTALCVVAVLCVLYPVAVFGILAGWAVLTLAVAATLKITAAAAHMIGRDDAATETRPNAAPLPRVSILVPLFRETEIAHALIARLARLTYPKCLLDVILVLEEEDHLTQATLAGYRPAALGARGGGARRSAAHQATGDELRARFLSGRHHRHFRCRGRARPRPDHQDRPPLSAGAPRGRLPAGHTRLLQPGAELAGALFHHRIRDMVPHHAAGDGAARPRDPAGGHDALFSPRRAGGSGRLGRA